MSIFSHVSVNKPRFNTFDLSHQRKFSGKVGQLIPCFLAEAVPNDSFKVDTSQLVRFAPLVSPVMHRFSIYVHFFFVPNRILWQNWEDFINGGEDGEQSPVFPFIGTDSFTNPNFTEGSLADYLGIPIDQDFTNEVNLSAIPFAVYMKIWYEYYRDQNLDVDSDYDFLKNFPLVDGDNDANSDVLTTIRARSWQHDYFTSALPWTQRGPEATIPLGDSAPITFDNSGVTEVTQIYTADEGDWSSTGNPDLKAGITAVGLPAVFQVDEGGGSFRNADVDNSPFLSADLSTATASTINDLRRAFRLQEWLELNARGGARYNETIKVHFGISPGDSRLQRPEFLGGSSTPVVISEVLQTSANSGQPSPLATMGGHGVSVGGKNVFYYKCREHGYIMGIMSLMPKSAYQQGLAKHWFKFDRFDYFWRSFANIGEQPILNKELYVDTTDAEDDNIFGYIPRYAEYKHINDSVHGEFRTSLDFWHAGRIFANRPSLSDTFVQCDSAEVDRIFAVSDTEQFYIQMHHRVKARRPMPYFGTPTI